MLVRFIGRLLILLNVVYYFILSLPVISLLDRLLYSVGKSKRPLGQDTFIRESSLFHIALYHEHIVVRKPDIKIHYTSLGISQNKPLMLFIHGFPECWYSWRYQLIEFWREFFVVAIDLRGFNQSSKPSNRSEYAIHHLVSDLKEIISQKSNNNKAIIVGHDWGAVVSWAFAHKHPVMVEKLIILSMPHPRCLLNALFNNERQLRKSWFYFLFQLPFLPERNMRANYASMVRNIFRAQMVHPENMSDEDIAMYQEPIVEGGAASAMINYYRNMFTVQSFRFWLSPSMKKLLGVDVLLIWGEKDVTLETSLFDQTKTYVNNITIKIVTDAGHWVHQDQPEAVSTLIYAFVK